MPACLIGLGSNQGDRQAHLDAAVNGLRQNHAIAVTAISSWRETAPIGGPADQPGFLNGVVRLETSLKPVELLGVLQGIETSLGRTRTQRWAARTVDLDLLLYGESILESPALTVPHPRMAWRRFVLEPAAEVAGEMLHPTIRWTIARLLEHLNRAAPYIAITGPIGVGKTWLAQRLAETFCAHLILEQPDWTRLDAFYTDPPGHALPIELGFVRHRARDLAEISGEEAKAAVWTVSDYWFDQSAAFARVWLEKEQWAEYFEQYEILRKQVVRPKLIVHLDAPADVLLARVQNRGRPCERRLTEKQLASIAEAIREQTTGPDIGPVFHADANDLDAAFTEVVAAMRGME